MGKLICEVCKKKCKGQAVKLSDDRYLHLKCFKCNECKKQLSPATFYTKEDGRHYCVDDYRRLFGTKCHCCSLVIEGEAVTALGKTYHHACLRCNNCSKSFGAGDKVTFNGPNCLCRACVALVQPAEGLPPSPGDSRSPKDVGRSEPDSRAPTLLVSSTPARPQEIALRQGQLGSPDSDYSTDIKDFMSDSRSPMSPVSATSGYKSEPSFEHGGTIGNGRTLSTGADNVFVDTNFANGVDHKEYLTPNSHFMQYRSSSPGSMSRTSGKSKDSSGSFGSSRRTGTEINYGKFFKTSFLDKKDGFKRGPSLNPVINEKQQHHYHRPEGFSYRKVRTDLAKPGKKGATRNLVSSSKRTSEPYKPFKNQDAIQLSKIPDAQKHETVYLFPIERDDFPSRPETAAVYPELLREHKHRRRGSRSDIIDGGTPSDLILDDNKENRPESASSGGRPVSSVSTNRPGSAAIYRPVSVSNTRPGSSSTYRPDSVFSNHNFDIEYDDDDEETRPVDPKILRDIEYLSKMPESGAAKIILEDLKKKQLLEPPALDPRSASRTPSAATEPPYKTRYEYSLFASPSRDLEMRARLQSMDESLSEIKYRTMTPPAAHFLGKFYTMPRNLVRNFSAPRPGYGLKSHTMDSRNGYLSDATEGYFQKWHSECYRRPESSAAVLERTSCHSSQSDLDEYDAQTGLRKNTRHRSTAGTDGRLTPNFSGRRSVPLIFKIEEPPKIYPYEQLRLSNRERPPGIDENRLEQNLTKEEFEGLFEMSHADFYHLAEWKRNDLKKRIDLF